MRRSLTSMLTLSTPRNVISPNAMIARPETCLSPIVVAYVDVAVSAIEREAASDAIFSKVSIVDSWGCNEATFTTRDLLEGFSAVGSRHAVLIWLCKPCIMGSIVIFYLASAARGEHHGNDSYQFV